MMENFNIADYFTAVSKLMDNEKKALDDSTAKSIFMKVAVEQAVNPQDLYNSLKFILEIARPYYRTNFNSIDWNTVYNHFIKKGDVLAENLQVILDCIAEDKNNQTLKEEFFNCVKEIGADPELMAVDMSIDLFGWLELLDIVSYMVKHGIIDNNGINKSLLESSEIIKSEPENKKKRENSSEKTRKRNVYSSIRQFNLDGTLVREWKSINEACATLKFKHPSISKCINGNPSYSTAYGYKWVGVPQEQSKENEAIPTAA